VLICFVAIYVAFLSVAAIVTTIVIVSIAATIFHLKNRRLVAEKQQSAAWERKLFDRLTDFLDGFKEIRLNNARSDDLFDDAVNVSRTAANIKIKSQAETFKLIVTSQISMYVLLGAVVFVAPQFSSDLGGAALTKTTTALMFIVGACFGLVQSIPVLLNANAAADRIEQLEITLRGAASSKRQDIPIPKHFDRIEMRNIEFRYVDRFSDVSFKIGPIDFELQTGELVFITGGNGSGKSTFLRVLSGLYPPESGEITLDGMHIDENTRDTYRNLMSAIFFDYHLFQRLYGITEPVPGEVDRLLAQFRLGDKTGLTDGQFRTLDLSGGQRRRLALIVSLLEKRPILLLDEWTAEQDPEFRRKFYDELLPDLMKAGATIVVITHDDRYLDELDLPARRIRMDEGRIVEQRSVQKG
jgi:putative ATP-binding cassette transporter